MACRELLSIVALIGCVACEGRRSSDFNASVAEVRRKGKWEGAESSLSMVANHRTGAISYPSPSTIRK